MFVYVYKILPAVLITKSMNGIKKKKPNITVDAAGLVLQTHLKRFDSFLRDYEE